MAIVIEKLEAAAVVPGGIVCRGQHEHTIIEEDMISGPTGHMHPWFREARFGAAGLCLRSGSAEVHIPLATLWAIAEELEPGLKRPVGN